MKTLKDFNFKWKKVLLRCDFNVPLSEKGEALDDFRIKKTIPTIEYLIKRKAKVILMSHLGSPGGKVVKKLSLLPVQKELEEYLGQTVIMAKSCLGKEVEKMVTQLKPGEILLLENLRFEKGEEEGNSEFAKKLSKLGDIYINEAFSASHRAHASIVGIPKCLPAGAGFLLEKEIKILSRLIEKPWRPLVVLIGGVKIETKIKTIERFLELADHLILGGQIANPILEEKGILVGKVFQEAGVAKIIKKINLTSPKLHLPVDGLISLKNWQENFYRKGGLASLKKDEAVFDIGPETIRIFSDIIKEAKMIFWSGPLGMYEEKKFETGTKEIAKAITRNHQAFKVAGGGDTISAINKWNLGDKFDHLSTGGGAMLEFLSGKKLPGIEALK